jgi:hypothetical protein
MADEDDVIEALAVDHADHIVDMRGERDAGADQMRAFAEPGQVGDEHIMPRRAQAIGNEPKAPATAPRPVDKHIGRHRSSPQNRFI